jgi:hypothetical protein
MVPVHAVVLTSHKILRKTLYSLLLNFVLRSCKKKGIYLLIPFVALKRIQAWDKNCVFLYNTWAM